jgi:BMFP domain-containing protein YqiC
MGTKVRVKPVQPTVITDKKIIREVIAQIRKPIPPEVEKRNQEIEDTIMKMIRR